MTAWELLTGFACDASADGAERAIVKVAKDEAMLQFCAHHFRQHEVMLDFHGWVITSDARAELLKPELV